MVSFFFSSRRRHTRLQGDWSSDVCSSDLVRGDRLRLPRCARGRTVVRAPWRGRLSSPRLEMLGGTARRDGMTLLCRYRWALPLRIACAAALAASAVQAGTLDHALREAEGKGEFPPL